MDTRKMVENGLIGRRDVKYVTEVGRNLDPCPQPYYVPPEIRGGLIKKLDDSRPVWGVAEHSARIDA